MNRIRAKVQPFPPAGQVESVPAPAPVTTADRIVLEIRKFIAAAIFFNHQAAEKVSLGLTDMQMLNLLQLHGPSTPGRLAGWTGLSSGGVTVALDRLERAGYIRRAPNPGDRRSLLITLTPVPMRRLARMYEGVEKETRRRLATLPLRDLEAVVRFFETMHATGADGNNMRKPAANFARNKASR
jgi:MarR family transcriptional regulator, organic hydroperoxide resistance regulator